jgi:hypothetical protein
MNNMLSTFNKKAIHLKTEKWFGNNRRSWYDPGVAPGSLRLA